MKLNKTLVDVLFYVLVLAVGMAVGVGVNRLTQYSGCKVYTEGGQGLVKLKEDSAFIAAPPGVQVLVCKDSAHILPPR